MIRIGEPTCGLLTATDLIRNIKEISMSRKFVRLIAPTAAALFASAMAIPASATETTFAAYTGLGVTMVATNPGTADGSLTLQDSSTITFGFQGNSFAAVIANVPADVVFTASSANSNFSTASALGGVAYQTGFGGSFTITSKQAYTVGGSAYAAGSNLLSASFTNATLLGRLGQRDAGFTADSLVGTLVYTSDFLNFGSTVSSDYSFSFGAIVPALSAGTIDGLPAYIEPFTATPTGSFASDTGNPVPEPATWGMMLVGLGAIGLSLRGNSRRRLTAA